MRSALLCAAWGALSAGCARHGDDSVDDTAGSTGPRTEALLVDMSAWEYGDPEVFPDPLPDHAPPVLLCPEGGALMEGASFEIRTGTCTYGWFQQPALADLRRGDRVELVFWHSALIADPPADGHVALFVGEHLLYERTIPIPADPAAYTEPIDVDFAAPEGAVVTLHLHNHGANDWNLLRLERTASE